jgi:hypothetical protein
MSRSQNGGLGRNPFSAVNEDADERPSGCKERIHSATEPELAAEGLDLTAKIRYH